MSKNKEEEVYAFLGPCGLILSGSKSAYRSANPTHLVVFNSNVCFLQERVEKKFFGLFKRTTTVAEKVWYGDFDLTANRNWLKNLAAATGETVILLTEMDARFENEDNPKFDNFVYKVTPSGDEYLGKWYTDNVMVTDEVIELIPTTPVAEDECCHEDAPKQLGIDAVAEISHILEEEVAATQPTPEAIQEATEALNAELAKVEEAKTAPVKKARKPKAPKAKPAAAAPQPTEPAKKARKPRAKKVVDSTKTTVNPSI